MGKYFELQVDKPMRIIRTVQSSEKPEPPKDQEILKKTVTTRRVVIQKQLPSARVATSIQKTVSNLQKIPGNPLNPLIKTQTADLVKKGPLQLQKPVGGRTVVKERPVTLRKVVVGDSPAPAIKKLPTPSNRVVVQKQVQVTRLTEGKSNTILIENLAASTSETQIRRMCQGIGTLEVIIFN